MQFTLNSSALKKVYLDTISTLEMLKQPAGKAKKDLINSIIADHKAQEGKLCHEKVNKF